MGFCGSHPARWQQGQVLGNGSVAVMSLERRARGCLSWTPLQRGSGGAHRAHRGWVCVVAGAPPCALCPDTCHCVNCGDCHSITWAQAPASFMVKMCRKLPAVTALPSSPRELGVPGEGCPAPHTRRTGSCSPATSWLFFHQKMGILSK